MRIGVTMRVTEADSYLEYRDTIAQDWNRFFSKQFPKDQYLFIPNIQESVTSYIEHWGIDVIFLSGGENIGIHGSRDKTELELIKYACNEEIPTIGVCRGMQMINHFFGGNVLEGDMSFKNRHVAKEHDIIFDGKTRKVNSYHGMQLTERNMGRELTVMAVDKKDGSIEAFSHKHLLGLMWHPEREVNMDSGTIDIIRNHINTYGA